MDGKEITGIWDYPKESAERNELVGEIIEEMPEVGLLGMIVRYGQLEGPTPATVILGGRIERRMRELSTLSLDELRAAR